MAAVACCVRQRGPRHFLDLGNFLGREQKLSYVDQAIENLQASLTVEDALLQLQRQIELGKESNRAG